MTARPLIDHARYTCGDVLGEGAQGVVVRVVDREQPTLPLVAKVTRDHGARDPLASVGSDARLQGEFAVLARLRIPGLVRVHDYAHDLRGVAFLVEDFVEGEDPTSWIDGRADRLVSLATDLAETLAGLHDAGYIHGDVKPDNVRVASNGRAMLLDLGAAGMLRAAGSGSRPREPIVFTEAFAAPELRAGAAPSAATDLHALGATLHACALPRSTALTSAVLRSPLRDRAPWVTPSVAAVIASLVAAHPADRPASARVLLGALGRSAPRAGWEAGSRGVHAREEVVTAVTSFASRAPRASRSDVLYVIGASGAGKSHVVREAATRLLLEGRTCRTLRFSVDDVDLTPRLVAYLRGDERALPWTAAEDVIVVLDELHQAPAEVSEALDTFRCRAHGNRRVRFVVTARVAPAGAATVVLAALDEAAFAVLCRELGTDPASSEAGALYRESGGVPGWAVASLGRVPLTRDAALARVRALDEAARDAFALVATFGGSLPEAALVAPGAPAPEAFAALFVAGLATRERGVVRMSSPQLAREAADALASFAISDQAASLVMALPELDAATLLAVGSAPSPPARRSEVLARAADQAKRSGARAVEIDALLALVASATERTPPRLARLERLTRDAGTSRAHPQVLTWLEEAAAIDPSVRALAARRRAEERARAGDHDAASKYAEEALQHARACRDVAEEGYVLATKGALRLFAADWASADEAFDAARKKLAAVLVTEPERLDREEVARLEHNAGVVALYRGRVPAAIDAFERSIGIKRALGDRAGIRACLLNLGLSLARADRHDEAELALVEATELAGVLGQAAGRAWCLAARADLAVRRGRARDAEQLVAEATAIGDAVPGAVRADLVLLRAQIALLEGDGRAALAALDLLAPDVRASDAMIDARALVITARARLSIMPADRRGGARAAIAALRAARAAGLADVEGEAAAALRAARTSGNERTRDGARAARAHEGGTPMGQSAQNAKDEDGRDRDHGDEGAWEVLAAIARETDAGVAIAKLAALVLGEARGERVIVAALGDLGEVERAWGIDIDGLPITQAEERIDAASVEAARRRGAPVYQSDVTTRVGAGARMVIAGERAAVVVEHRFLRGAFDHVEESAARRWGVMAEVAVRVAGADVGAVGVGAGAGAGVGAGVGVEKERERRTLFSTAMPTREAQRDYPEILGRSATLRRALAQLDAAVDTELPVVVAGETGTGKELFARALHDHGPRSAKAFVAVNCAAIADALFEAELFGHARGAFTGADRARPGLLARAEGGTLLLDEIGELPLARQATLLRALETRRYRAVGSDDERAFDVRIVCATNRDLDAAVEEGTFRRDLLYRLRVLEIVVPALRDRAGDVELLVRHFLVKAGSRATISPSALEALEDYTFPGNVRELLHVTQRLAAARVDRVDVAHLPRAVRAVAQGAASAGAAPRAMAASESRPSAARGDDETAEVEAALGRTAGNISQAAVLLGLSRHGLKKRMLRLGLRAKGGGG